MSVIVLNRWLVLFATRDGSLVACLLYFVGDVGPDVSQTRRPQKHSFPYFPHLYLREVLPGYKSTPSPNEYPKIPP
jgi:hypothetical protein